MIMVNKQFEVECASGVLCNRTFKADLVDIMNEVGVDPFESQY